MNLEPLSQAMPSDSPRSAFANVISQYCVLQSLQDRGAALSGEADIALDIKWDDVGFVVGHSLSRQPEYLRLECQLGSLPQNQSEAAMRRLLSIQRELVPSASSMVGLDERSGAVCQVQMLPLNGLDGAVLLAEMQRMYDRAGEWRRSSFLQEDH